MNTERISGVYARALIEIGRSTGRLADLGEEMAVWHGTIRKSPEFRAFLASPRIPAAGKMQVISGVFGKGLSDTFMGFVGVVLEKRRGVLFHEIAKIFRRELDAILGRSAAVVRTAVPLQPGTAERLKKSIEEKLRVVIVLDEKLDPSVIGGLWVRVGDKVLDGTVITRLKGYRKLMAAGRIRSEVIYED